MIIANTEVQILPTSISPLYASALKESVYTKVDDQWTRIASKEHLIIMALVANRPKDRFKAVSLLRTASKTKVSKLLKRFDIDGTLRKRYKEVVQSSNS